ncbi:MAG: hypothetical protein OXD42_04650 [Rhodospirillaceae bacterium]|nr:hypothetical protein [Rhodospirillaceae bacterium]
MPPAGRSGHDGVFDWGIFVCVENCSGWVGGKEGLKLEEQVLITTI